MSDLKALNSEPRRNNNANHRPKGRRTSSSSCTNVSKEMTDPCKLYVSSIPCEFNHDKLHQVFSEVLIPRDVFLSGKKGGGKFLYALVSYDSPSDALVVLQKLNKAPPHQFNISFALNTHSKSNKNHTDNTKSDYPQVISKKPQLATPLDSSVGSDEDWGDSSGSHRSSPFLPNDRIPQTSTKFNGATSPCNKKLPPRTPPVNGDKSIQNNICERTAPFGDLGQYGKNRISNLQVPLKINYNKACAYVRERVFDGNRKFMQDVEGRSSCQLCGGARFECFSCSFKYCRDKCAKSDLYNVKCTGITDIPNVNGGTPIVDSDQITWKQASTEAITWKQPSTEAITWKQPSTEPITWKQASTEPITWEQASTEAITWKRPSTEPITWKQPSTEVIPVEQPNNPKSNQTPADKNTSSGAVKMNLCPIPFGRYSTVIVLIPLGGCEYWVVPKELSSTIDQVMKELENACLSNQLAFKPNLSEKCAAPYDEIWHRAEILCKRGDKYMVRFIDFGNTEELRCEDIRKLPPSLEKIPPLAFKIKLEEGTSKQYSDIDAGGALVVKPVIMCGDSWLVHVEGQVEDKRMSLPNEESQASVKPLGVMHSGNSRATLRSKWDYGVTTRHVWMIGDTLNFNFKLRVSRVISESEVTGTLIVSGLERWSNLEIESELKLLEPEERGSPPLGQLVCCVTEDGLWARGYPINLAPVNVALVDYAVVARADTFCTLRGAVSDVPLAGIRCKMDRPARVNQSDLLWGRGISLEKEGYRVKLEGLGDGLLVPWDPQADPDGLIKANLPSGSQVFITEYVSPKELYVRSASPEAVQVLNSIMAQTATCAKNHLDRPLLGQVHACLYEDDCFYRAQIIEQNGDSYTVMYIDYGNKSKVRKGDLRELDAAVKLAPAMAVKVGLRGAEGSRKSLPESSADTKYTIHHEGDLSSVTLSDNKGTLNERLSTPPVPDVRNIGVKYVYWPEGQKIKIEMKSKVGCNSYRAIRLDDPHLEYVNTTLSERLESYASKFVGDYRHRPGEGEVVVVRRGDGQWWRGVCVEKRTGGRCVVTLLDRGLDEEVSEIDMRPVKEELLRAAVVVRSCVVHGVPEELPGDVDSALERFLVEASSLEAVVMDDCCEGRAIVYLPALVTKASIIGIPAITPPSFP